MVWRRSASRYGRSDSSTGRSVSMTKTAMEESGKVAVYCVGRRPVEMAEAPATSCFSSFAGPPAAAGALAGGRRGFVGRRRRDGGLGRRARRGLGLPRSRGLAGRRLARGPASATRGRGRGRGFGRRLAVHVRARLLVAPERQQAARLGLFEQVAEGAKAVVRLVEIGLPALDGLFQHRGPDLAAIAPLGHQVVEGFDSDLDALGAARLELCLAMGV